MDQTIRTVKLPWGHRNFKLGCENQFEILVIDLKLFYSLSDSSNYPFYVHLAQSLDYLQTFCLQCRAAMHAIQQQLENMAHWFESHVLVTNYTRQSGGGAEWIEPFGWSSFYNAAWARDFRMEALLAAFKGLQHACWNDAAFSFATLGVLHMLICFCYKYSLYCSVSRRFSHSGIET